MSRYTKQERARILAEADMQMAIRRADVAREKYLLMLQKEKMGERQLAPDSQRVTRTYGVSASRPAGYGTRRPR
jgi:hypothetical protein